MTVGPDQVAKVLRGYAADAVNLIPAYETVSSERVFAPIMDWLPQLPATVLDLGAGTGRDAAWLCQQGYRIWAVEPVRVFREAGKALHGKHAINWVDDRLPELARVSAMSQRFDLIVANAVLHHLTAADQVAAISMASGLLESKGRMICALRHGPTPASRPGYPVLTQDLMAAAQMRGLRLCYQRTNLESHQTGNRRAGVSWDWLMFVRE